MDARREHTCTLLAGVPLIQHYGADEEVLLCRPRVSASQQTPRILNYAVLSMAEATYRAMSMLEIRKKKEKKKENNNLLCTAMTTLEKEKIYTVDGHGEVQECKERLHDYEYVLSAVQTQD